MQLKFRSIRKQSSSSFITTYNTPCAILVCSFVQLGTVKHRWDWTRWLIVTKNIYIYCVVYWCNAGFWCHGNVEYLNIWINCCMQFITRRVCNIYDVVLFFHSARRYFYVCHMFIYFAVKIAIQVFLKIKIKRKKVSLFLLER